MNNIINKIDLIPRKMISEITYPFNKKKINKLYNEIININERSDVFSKQVIKFGQELSPKQDVLCNIENNTLEKLTHSNLPVIYVINHSNQRKDPKLLAFFNSLLNLKYLEFGTSHPRSKFILNENIILSQPKQLQEIYKKFGAVGINIFNNKNNAGVLKELINGYMNKEYNIFIFPEGKNCTKKFLPFEKRFKTGVSKIINTVVKKNKCVKVVPLGFEYTNKNNLFGCIQIGKPIYFRQKGDSILTNNGNKIEHIKNIQDITAKIIDNMKNCMSEAKMQLKNN